VQDPRSLFLTLYVPCASTFAVMLKTIGRREARFSVTLSVGAALPVSGLVRFALKGPRSLVARLGYFARELR